MGVEDAHVVVELDEEAKFAQVVHTEPGNATAEGPVNMPTMAWITLAAQNQL